MKMFWYMKIFDCFTYFNESYLMSIRFEELNDVVDYFVVVESSETFTGTPKPFYFDDLPKSWIEKYKNKIIRVKIDFPYKDMSSWEREYYQRNQIIRGLKSAKKKDLIIISDADEIVNRNVFGKLRKIKSPIRIDVKQYFWNFNWQVPQHCNQGARPVACRYKDLIQTSAQTLRADTTNIISDGGWHFSFLGQPELIKNKIEAFAHTEYNAQEYKDTQKILYRIENGIDPFDRFPLKYYDISNTYPIWFKDNFLD